VGDEYSFVGGRRNFGGVASGRVRLDCGGSWRSVSSMTFSVSVSTAECRDSYLSASVWIVAAV
jgi:hypothetical protein